MRLYVVRHGETDYNRKRQMQGYKEIPLNDLGIAQAARVAQRLATESVDCIVCSDLRRAVMTGCIIASCTGAPMSYDPALRERNPGDLVEKSYDLEPRFFTDEHYVPPAGEGVFQFRQRVRGAFDALAAQPNLAGKRVVVVTHGLVCNAFVREFFGEAASAGVGSRNTSMTVADYADGEWTLVQADCVAHLGAQSVPVRDGAWPAGA